MFLAPSQIELLPFSGSRRAKKFRQLARDKRWSENSLGGTVPEVPKTMLHVITHKVLTAAQLLSLPEEIWGSSPSMRWSVLAAEAT